MQKNIKDAFITGDMNTELPARRGDDQEIAKRMEEMTSAAGYVNLVSKPTHLRPNTRASQIDFIFSKKIISHEIEYLTMNQAPLYTDGHCGLEFVAGASPKPIQYEVCKTYKDKTWIQIDAINKIRNLLADEYKRAPGGRAQLRRMHNILVKSKTNDEVNYGNRLGKSIEDRRHRIWSVLKEATGAPPLSRLEQTVEILADRVSELQTKTITHDRPYDEHEFKLKTRKKLTRFRANYHGANYLPSFRRLFDRLCSFTKGASGLSKNFIDKIPICWFVERIYKPMIATLNRGIFPSTLRVSFLRYSCFEYLAHIDLVHNYFASLS
jgi:hypothetical protein